MISARQKKHAGALATGSLLAILFLFGGHYVRAYTDSGQVPQMATTTTTLTFTAGDAAACVAVNATYDRFVVAHQTTTGFNTVGFLFAGAPYTISTSTRAYANEIGLYFYCSDSSKNYNFDTTFYNAQADYFSGSSFFSSLKAFDLASASGNTTTTVTVISTSTQETDNANLDYGMGIAIFLGTAWFIIWVFRRRNS